MLQSVAAGVVTDGDWMFAIQLAARFRSLSFANALLVDYQHAQAYRQGRVGVPWPSLVGTRRQWETLGCRAGRGQHGYLIHEPVTTRHATWAPGDPGSWRVLGPRERPRPGEAVQTRVTGMRTTTVWDVSQMSPDSPVPVVSSPVVRAGATPDGLWAGLVHVAAMEGYTVRDVSGGPQEGAADPKAQTITVGIDATPAARAQTLAHHLAHILMHDPRSDAVRSHRGLAEVEAQSVAVMIVAAHGMPADCYTLPPVTTWARDVEGHTPMGVVLATGEKVRRTATSVLTLVETRQTSGGMLATPAVRQEPGLPVLCPAPPVSMVVGG